MSLKIKATGGKTISIKKRYTNSDHVCKLKVDNNFCEMTKSMVFTMVCVLREFIAGTFKSMNAQHTPEVNTFVSGQGGWMLLRQSDGDVHLVVCALRAALTKRIALCMLRWALRNVINS